MASIDSNAIDQKHLVDALDSLLTDVTAAKTAIDAMATKLNADAGVTDTDYASMASLTTTS